MLYIVIPVFNRWQFTKECLRSLSNQNSSEFEIVVVDHGSTDDTKENLKVEFPKVNVVTGNSSMWWAEATNIGIQFALEHGASNILTLNNDLIIGKDYISHLLCYAQKHRNVIIGSMAVDFHHSDKLIFSGLKWNKWTAKVLNFATASRVPVEYEKEDYFKTDLLPGRGTLFPTQVFADIGMFDSRNFPHYGADEDLSLRCKSGGYDLIVLKKAIVFSHVKANGVNDFVNQNMFSSFLLSLTSIKSPANLKRRWFWSKKHSPIPLLYFTFDVARIFSSMLVSLFK